jgi:hypothetical protein
MIAARLADLKNGTNQHKKEGAPIGAPSTEGKTREEAIKDLEWRLAEMEELQT